MTGRKGTFFYILCAVLSGASLVGCGGGENTEEVFVVEKEENEVEYSMAAVTRGDVVLSQKIPCVYEQVNEEEDADRHDDERGDHPEESLDEISQHGTFCLLVCC